jgi:hypothetical protein
LRGIEHRELPFSSLPRQQGTALRLGLLSLGHHIKELDDHHEPLRRGACRIEGLQKEHSAPGVKQQLAAVRMLFDWLITGQVLPTNGGGRARAEACGEDRLDAGARRRRVAQAPQIEPGHDIARPARPG